METAKNLILAGPGLVSLCDDEPVAMPDLGANFFLEEGDVGKPRARCVRSFDKQIRQRQTERDRERERERERDREREQHTAHGSGCSLLT